MKELVRFGVILNRIASVAGWVFCLVLLAHWEERSFFGFALLMGWTFWQTLRVIELVGRRLLGRLDEKEERMQRTADRLCAHLGESRATRIFVAVYAVMLAVKLALPAGLNRI